MRHTPGPFRAFRPLVVIPCLNEERHIGHIASQMRRAVRDADGLVVIVDGGSRDGTVSIAEDLCRDTDGIVLLHNAARLQGPGINAAVRGYGDGFTHLVRVDAHAGYPDDFIDVLRQEAVDTGASSVVVGMVAAGDALLQRINASAQNARIGNGGSLHRQRGTGRFVDHGHHALMQLDAFREVGGYDESFSHNEDAELDYRLVQSGHRIWLTARTEVTYFPRATLGALARQYFNYGKGRAKNLLKHSAYPKLRQAAVIAVAPGVLLAGLAPAAPFAALPALLWASACIAGGAALTVRRRDPVLLLSGPVAMLMHLSWSLGFWVQALSPRPAAREGVSA